MNYKRMAKYERSQVVYTMQKAQEAGLITVQIQPTNEGYYVFFRPRDGLTFQGHQFLDNVRADTVWKRVLGKVAKVGGTASLPILQELASECMKQMLGLG